jgi:hypothetical protein
VLVEREIGDEPLEPIVLVLELPEPTELAHSQVGVLLLPDLERRLTHAHLPTDIRYCGTALDPAERARNLLLAELQPLHGALSS